MKRAASRTRGKRAICSGKAAAVERARGYAATAASVPRQVARPAHDACHRCRELGGLDGLGDVHEESRAKGAGAIFGTGEGGECDGGQAPAPRMLERAHASEQLVA